MRPIEVGCGRFDQAIVGESHYQNALRHMKDDAFIAEQGVTIANEAALAAEEEAELPAEDAAPADPQDPNQVQNAENIDQ